MKLHYLLPSLLLVDSATGFTVNSPLVSSPAAKPSFRRKISLELASGGSTDTEETEQTGVFSQDVQDEAKQALASVGWAKPLDDGEMTSDDPFVKQIDEGIQRDYGVNLDDLLNPAKVRPHKQKFETIQI